MVRAIPDRPRNPRYPPDGDRRWEHSPLYVVNRNSKTDPRAIQYLLNAMVTAIKEYLAQPREPQLSVEDLIVSRVGKHALKADTNYSRIEAVVVDIYKMYFPEVFKDSTPDQVATILRLRERQQPSKRADLMVWVAAATQLILRFMEDSVDYTAATSDTDEPPLRPRTEHPLIIISMDDWRQHVTTMAVAPASPMGLAPTPAVIALENDGTDHIPEIDYAARHERMVGHLQQEATRGQIAMELIASQRDTIELLTKQIETNARDHEVMRKRLFGDAFGGEQRQVTTGNLPIPSGPSIPGNPPGPPEQAIPGFAPHVTRAQLDQRRAGPGIRPSEYSRTFVNKVISNKIKSNQVVTTSMLYSAGRGGSTSNTIDVKTDDHGGVSLVTTNTAKVAVRSFADMSLVGQVLVANLHDAGDPLAAGEIRTFFIPALREAYDNSGDNIAAVVHYADNFLDNFLDARYNGLHCSVNFDSSLLERAVFWCKRRRDERTRVTPSGRSPNKLNQHRVPRILDQGKLDPRLATEDCLNWQAGRDCAMRIGHINGPCPMKHKGTKGANPDALYQRPRGSFSSSGTPAKP